MYFFLWNSTRRFTCIERLLQNSISSFTLTILPWITKFLFTDNIFLPRLIKKESCRSSHCIFQGVYALNMRSIKILQRSVVKVLITLLTKQYFYATYWLVINKCLRSVIGRNIWKTFPNAITKVTTRAW